MGSPKDALNDLSGRSPKRIVKNLKELEALIEDASSEVMRQIQLRVMQTLPSATPVDLGTARSGWTPNIGSPVADRIFAPKDEGEARNAAANRLSKNRAKAEEIANTYRLERGPIFISNPVPWIVPLNMGTSAQAPENFVERAIETAVRAAIK